jgi:hypothetical protein
MRINENQRNTKKSPKNKPYLLIRPNLWSREELDDFLWWKHSTHIIDQSHARETN